MKKIKEKLFIGYLYLCLGWVCLALSFQTYMMYLNFSGQEAKAAQIATTLTHKLDGRFQ
jgi:hypothetical protein